MSPQLSWINLGGVPLSSLSSTSMSSSDNWMKSLPLRNLCPIPLLQTAVHNIPELRMVETMEEFISLSSTTPGPTMGYDSYITLLQNACIRYDSNQNSRPSPASRAAYQLDLSPDHHDNLYPQDYSSSGTTYGGIDMPTENSTRSILPTSIGLLLSPPLPLGNP